MSQPNNNVVVIDASVMVAICAKEQNKQVTAKDALDDYVAKGRIFYAPGVIVSEVMYVLCLKLQDGLLIPALSRIFTIRLSISFRRRTAKPL